MAAREWAGCVPPEKFRQKTIYTLIVLRYPIFALATQ
jgi:hypothetical protein